MTRWRTEFYRDYIMSFVKLDCAILNSTLWFERDSRELFITALLLATPREYNEPVQEIEPGVLRLTGWAAPPGWYGFVAAAGPGIIARAGMEQEGGQEALKKLAAPDPESRSHEHEGRRMIRVDGGYLILNYQKYRDKDHTAASRAKRYRDKKKAAVNEKSPVTHSERHPSPSSYHGVTTRNITQAEAEEYNTRSTAPPVTLGTEVGTSGWDEAQRLLEQRRREREEAAAEVDL